MQSSTASFGVVPFENSSNGSVIFTLDLLADIHTRYQDILVCGEIYLPVHHCLLGRISHSISGGEQPTTSTKRPDLATRALGDEAESGAITPTQSAPRPQRPRVQPAHSLGHIKKLYSHPQAWGQCKLFLSTYLKGVERQDVSSTSRAAELVADDASGTSAAISSKIAAGMNGLDVLAEGMEDEEGNSTRFFVLRRASDAAAPQDEEPSRSYKSLVSFTVSHAEPGALARCLDVFYKNGLNLTSINTRPRGDAPWHYIFFVEFLGRKESDGERGAVNVALKQLSGVARGWRWLGSWEAWQHE